MENKYIARLQDEKIKELMNDFTAILIRGPKWCGKSTTALHFAKSYIKLNTKKQREKFDEMQKDDRWNEFLENSQLAGIDMDPNDVTDRINTEFGEIKEIMGIA